MEAMTHPLPTWGSPSEIRLGINVLMADREVNVDDVADGSRISRSTFYRRLNSPDTFTTGEFRRVADYFRIPTTVLAGGKFAVMRWLADQGPDGGPGLGVSPSGWDGSDELARARRSKNQVPRLVAA